MQVLHVHYIIMNVLKTTEETLSLLNNKEKMEIRLKC